MIFTQQSNDENDPITDAFIKRVMKEYDTNKDGTLDINEFYFIMNGLVEIDQ